MQVDCPRACTGAVIDNGVTPGSVLTDLFSTYHTGEQACQPLLAAQSGVHCARNPLAAQVHEGAREMADSSNAKTAKGGIGAPDANRKKAPPRRKRVAPATLDGRSLPSACRARSLLSPMRSRLPDSVAGSVAKATMDLDWSIPWDTSVLAHPASTNTGSSAAQGHSTAPVVKPSLVFDPPRACVAPGAHASSSSIPSSSSTAPAAAQPAVLCSSATPTADRPHFPAATSTAHISSEVQQPVAAPSAATAVAVAPSPSEFAISSASIASVVQPHLSAHPCAATTAPAVQLRYEVDPTSASNLSANETNMSVHLPAASSASAIQPPDDFDPSSATTIAACEFHLSPYSPAASAAASTDQQPFEFDPSASTVPAIQLPSEFNPSSASTVLACEAHLLALSPSASTVRTFQPQYELDPSSSTTLPVFETHLPAPPPAAPTAPAVQPPVSVHPPAAGTVPAIQPQLEFAPSSASTAPARHPSSASTATALPAHEFALSACPAPHSSTAVHPAAQLPFSTHPSSSSMQPAERPPRASPLATLQTRPVSFHPSSSSTAPVVPSRGPEPVADQPLAASTANLKNLYVFTSEKNKSFDKNLQLRVIEELSKDSAHMRHALNMDRKHDERIANMRATYDAYTASEMREFANKAAELRTAVEAEAPQNEHVCVVIDMDMFFAACELLDRPDLCDKPVAVGGKFMISTANYVARSYGVRSAMPGFIAEELVKRQGGTLVFVPTNYEKYQQASNTVRTVLDRWHLNFTCPSLDEFYITCPGSLQEVSELITRVRADIFSVTGLTASAGIGPIFMLAKMAADVNKPNGQFTTPHDLEELQKWLGPMSVRKVGGVGRVNQKILEAFGLYTLNDIAENSAKVLALLGTSSSSYGPFLVRAALGRASGSWELHESEGQKSISQERTFGGISDKIQLREIIYDLCVGVWEQCEKKELFPLTITVKVKKSSFETLTRCRTLAKPVRSLETLEVIAWELLCIFKANNSFPRLRLLGVRASHWYDENEGADSFASRKRASLVCAATRTEKNIDSFFAKKQKTNNSEALPRGVPEKQDTEAPRSEIAAPVLKTRGRIIDLPDTPEIPVSNVNNRRPNMKIIELFDSDDD